MLIHQQLQKFKDFGIEADAARLKVNCTALTSFFHTFCESVLSVGIIETIRLQF